MIAHRLGSGVLVNGMSLALRRRRDGYTRIEVAVFVGTHLETDALGNGRFVLYLNDDERRRLADALRPDADDPPHTPR